MVIHTRPAELSDLPDIRNLFADTIAGVCIEYDEQQRRTWASAADDESRWHRKFENQLFFVAEEHGQQDPILRGFASLQPDGYIDFFFVHSVMQRSGIGQVLYKAVEDAARQLGVSELNADVSLNARHFFERMGFGILCEQTVVLGGLPFKNYKMHKYPGRLE